MEKVLEFAAKLDNVVKQTTMKGEGNTDKWVANFVTDAGVAIRIVMEESLESLVVDGHYVITIATPQTTLAGKKPVGA